MALLDLAYKKLVDEVLQCGNERPSRVGPTISLPGVSIKTAPVMHEFPLLTTRQIFYTGVLGELCAFMRGATKLQEFEDMGCKYWAHNAMQWTPNAGLDPKDMSVGKIYGYQWRHWNDELDQMVALIEGIRKDPFGRRHILTTWNPSALPAGCLPPCHLLAQFYIARDSIDCIIYMRSVDLALGLPSDLVLYAGLLMLIAQATDYNAGRLHFQFGDAHVYKAHVEQLKEQMQRKPSIYVPAAELETLHDVLSPWPSDFTIDNYFPQKAIKYELF